MALLYRMGTGNGSGGDLKPFIINFTCDSGFIGKTVTMEFQGTPHAGETVDNVSGTVVLDGTDGKGKLTLYPMHDGSWKYYATSDVIGYHEGTIELDKWGNYPVELNDTPDGATVTPTDDVQTWLHCANIWDKTNLTTIDDVITDTTTLNTLIANENANDYLVRSTTWASDVCSNESAMIYIGLNNYCANKLLADSTWCTAICNSPHFKKVLNVEVPEMISNTQPRGEANGSSILDSANDYYYAFDNKTSTIWVPNTRNGANEWISYKFEKPVCVKKVDVGIMNLSQYSHNTTFKIQASDDGINWEHDVSENLVNNESVTVKSYNINSDKEYQYYRLYIISQTHTTTYGGLVNTLQFYGREA